MVEESVMENYSVNSGGITTEIIQDKQLIMRYLQLGTNIPVLPQFRKYILRNIIRSRNSMQVKD